LNGLPGVIGIDPPYQPVAPEVRNGTRRCLSQAGWAVSAKKDNYLAAFYRRVAARRGAKRAIIAVAHQLLVIAYHLLKRKEQYRELGPNHFDNINADRVRRSLVKRLERLRHVVTLQPATPSA
jgi:hypothetical protein